MNLWKKTTLGLVVVGVSATVAVGSLDKYESPSPKGRHEMEIDSMTAEEKHKYKADVLKNVQFPNLDQDVYGEFIVEDVEIQVFSLLRQDDLLRVDVKASRNGQDLKVDNPLFFKNPPVKVPTGKFHKEVVDGQEKDVPNFREDPEEALKEIIWQVIKLQNNL